MRAVIIPLMKSADEKRKELMANCEIPLIMCPEVQSPPKRAPKRRRNPPTKDQTNRLPGFEPNRFLHSIGTTLVVKRAVAIAATNAPNGIPNTKKNS
jgi:hypothetical protein